MYSGILLSTSSLYQTYPFYQNQNSDMNLPIPPGFAPIQPGFGENHHEYVHGQPHSSMNPAYQAHQMHPVHETPSRGFGFQRGQVMDNAPFYHGFSYQCSVQQQVMTYPVSQPATQAQHQQVQVERGAQQVMTYPVTRPGTQAQHQQIQVERSAQQVMTYPVTQPATQAQHQQVQVERSAQQVMTYPVTQPGTQAQHQQVQVERSAQQVMTYPVTQPATQAQHQQVQVETSAQQDVLVVELERPVLPNTRPRLRWTHELHERFTRAAQELGGYFKATPKGIQKKMNVRGITRDQLKSHLQKVRNRVLHNESPEEITGPGTQYNTNISAPRFSEGQHGRLFGGCEAPNHHSNHMIGPVEDPANNFSFKNFSCPSIPQTSNYHQNLWSALRDNHAHKEIKFKDSDFY